jgi:hypothetical protein
VAACSWLKGDKFLIYAAGESGKTMASLADSLYRGTAQLKVDKVQYKNSNFRERAISWFAVAKVGAQMNVGRSTTSLCAYLHVVYG